jgi:hypothetical protein
MQLSLNGRAASEQLRYSLVTLPDNAHGGGCNLLTQTADNRIMFAPLELNQCPGDDHRPVKERCQNTALARKTLWPSAL